MIQVISYIALILVMKTHFNDTRLRPQPRSSQFKKKERLNKRTSIMALLLCSLSLISRTVLLVAMVSLNLNPDFFGYFTLALSDFIIFFNAGILFFVCFGFNKIFRNYVLKSVGIRSSSKTTSSSGYRSNNRN